MSTPLCDVRGLHIVVGGTAICQSLDLTVRAGECWAILGMNGVGKTTLLHTLAGLRAAESGDIRVGGSRLAELSRREIAKRLALMPQLVEDAFPATVFEETLAGRNPHLSPWAWESTEDEAIARTALAEVGLTALESRLTTTLSGGERRRVQLAALLVQDAPLMLLDEPVNHLDLHRQVMLLELVKQKVAGNPRAAIMSLHDVNLASRFCDHVLLMFGTGECASGTAADMLTENMLSRVYCHSLRVFEVDGRRYFVAA
ncbi:MAG: ABC transporter ATP-binding protein [Sterolibacteriaceae bacterium]|nr:ABC transporter ATP-binding protein [Candidatus Methylophosphatis haderslevensis]